MNGIISYLRVETFFIGRAGCFRLILHEFV